MRLSYRALLCTLAVAATSFSVSAAEPSAAAKQEVDQLLTRLAASGCTFQRNGTWHSAVDARSHLQKKYEYLLDKKRVGVAEDFIALGASKSSTSGTAYQVKCGVQDPVPSAAWMTAQLKEVRPQAAPKNK
jgi:hypothetical protein